MIRLSRRTFLKAAGYTACSLALNSLTHSETAYAQQAEFSRYSNARAGIAIRHPKGMEVYDYGLYDNEVNASYESGMIVGNGNELMALVWYTPRTNFPVEKRLQLGIDILKRYLKGVESIDAFGSVVEIKDSETTKNKGRVLFQRLFVNKNIPGIESVWQSPTERFFHFYLIAKEGNMSRLMETYIRTIEEFI